VLFADRVVPRATSALDGVPFARTSPLPLPTGPPNQMTRVHTTVDARLFRGLPPLPFPAGFPAGPVYPTVQPGGWSRLPWSSVPFNGILARAPCGSWSRSSRDPPRFRPQAFSASRRLAQARVPRPCFMPQPFLSFFPRAFPSQRSRSPSRGVASRRRVLPCGYPPTCGAYPPRSCHRRFPPTPAPPKVTTSRRVRTNPTFGPDPVF
jgi:hypothetical protein